MNALILNRKTEIERFCRTWKIRDLLAFGSITTDHFRPTSDIDLVADFQPGMHPTLIQLAQMEEELERIFDRKIDLLTRKSVEKSRNYIRKKAILSTMERIYAA